MQGSNNSARRRLALALYSSLFASGRTFDRHPALKMLLLKAPPQPQHSGTSTQQQQTKGTPASSSTASSTNDKLSSPKEMAKKYFDDFLGKSDKYWPSVPPDPPKSLVSHIRAIFKANERLSDPKQADSLIDSGFETLRHLNASLKVGKELAFDQKTTDSSEEDTTSFPVKAVKDLGAGVVLVSHPMMVPYWRYSVILIVNYDKAFGAIGLILNSTDTLAGNVSAGGPLLIVPTVPFWLTKWKLEDSLEVMEGLYFSKSAKANRQLLDRAFIRTLIHGQKLENSKMEAKKKQKRKLKGKEKEKEKEIEKDIKTELEELEKSMKGSEEKEKGENENENENANKNANQKEESESLSLSENGKEKEKEKEKEIEKEIEKEKEIEITSLDEEEKSQRCFFGFAQWQPGQLEREIAEGSWLVMSTTPRLVLSYPLKSNSTNDESNNNKNNKNNKNNNNTTMDNENKNTDNITDNFSLENKNESRNNNNIANEAKNKNKSKDKNTNENENKNEKENENESEMEITSRNEKENENENENENDKEKENENENDKADKEDKNKDKEPAQRNDVKYWSKYLGALGGEYSDVQKCFGRLSTRAQEDALTKHMLRNEPRLGFFI